MSERTLRFSHEIAVSIDEAWRRATSFEHLREISRPLITLHPRSPIPQRWDENVDYEVTLRLGGVIPWSHHTIRFLEIDPIGKRFLTHERGGPIRRWRHQCQLTKIDASKTRSDDTITFEAGAWNAFVTYYATAFYRYRYFRWRRLVSRGQ